jgi:diguanylate cyclase (GGDEF)-like protein/PAS domain S-box-containing protein
MRKRRKQHGARGDNDPRAQLLALHEVALGTMSHGLCMYDAALRLALFNARFLQTYNLPPEAVEKGDTIESVYRKCAASIGLTGVTTDEGWAKRRARLIAGKEFQQRQRFPDGRTVAVHFRPLPEGGWVGVFEDITRQQEMEEQLRQQIVRMDQALENMSHGLSMFGADERLIVCNRQYIELYDLDPEVVKPGITHKEILENWVSRGNSLEADGDQLYAIRKGAIDAGDRTNWLSSKDGRIIEARSRTMPGGGWVTASDDITEQLKSEAALREQNLRFDAALKNMSQGLCMYDADLRLIVHNEKYLQVFNYDPTIVKPGVLLNDVLAHGIDSGRIRERIEEINLRRQAASMHGPASYDRRIANDRTISICHCPMPDGGFVSTFEDVTERRRLESERKAAVIELKEQHRRFDAALNNMPHGVSMLDHDLRIIVTNRQWLDMFGLSPEVVKPGVTMQEVMHHSVAVGNYGDINADDLYRDLVASLEAGITKFYRHLPNGRTVLSNYNAMSEGGYVATFEDITERKRAEDRISHMASHDALTGLPNRVLFRDKMDDGLARVKTDHENMAVLCLDLDNFKSVNDTLGHPIGDRFLTTVADILGGVIGERDTVARLGGDEFAIVQCGPQPESAEKLAHRIFEALSGSILIDDHEINTAVSIGIAVAPNDGDSGDHLMKCADLALYRAKAEGRARYCFFETAMDTRLQERRALEMDLRKAFAADQFSLMYQPQVRLCDGELRGMEALLRWTHPQRGTVSPADFIPIAEENGLIVPIGEWVLRQACMEAVRWPDHITVAVNLSAVQFKSRGLVATIANALAMAGLPPRRLELEITEAVLLQDDEATLRVLHQLRAFGIRISMDDFGTGYSSLSYLRSFPFDKLKIDRSFLSDSGAGKDSGAIIRTIAGLGASLGIDTTAEGVETAEQLELVRRSGCTEYQGYYFSPPRSAAEVLAMMTPSEQAKAVA